jgi:CIC family chloride channel protein
MVCELAGSYDLLVPLMLAVGIAFVALRSRSLYHSQVATQHDSPAHPPIGLDVLRSVAVGDVMVRGRAFVSFEPGTPASAMLPRIADAGWQDTFPVLDAEGRMLGMVNAETLRILAGEPLLLSMTLAVDAMQPAAVVRADDNLRTAAKVMVENLLREVPVADAQGRIVGFVDEAEVGKAYLEMTARIEGAATSTPAPLDVVAEGAKGEAALGPVSRPR